MRTVSSLLAKKGSDVWSVSPETSVFEALGLMAEKNVGALLVLDGGQIAGIFSERDYARKVILLGKTSQDTPVKDIMTREVACVSPAQSTDECMAVMTKKRIRHLPVLDAGNLAGIISIGDVVQSIISRQEHHIEQLENYITSR